MVATVQRTTGSGVEQFIAVAVAHFLALLIPGVDFFLISRTAMVSGWRSASGVCWGIAAANGILITVAFCGLSLISSPLVLLVVQLAGGAFLTHVGVAFLRSAGHVDLGQAPAARQLSWRRNVGLGVASGLLNPKNALFYVSLASVIAGAAPHVLVGYGVWMVAVVLAWDLLVAGVLGSPRVLARSTRVVPWVTRVAGAFLLVFGIGTTVGALLRLVARG